MTIYFVNFTPGISFPVQHGYSFVLHGQQEVFEIEYVLFNVYKGTPTDAESDIIDEAVLEAGFDV